MTWTYTIKYAAGDDEQRNFKDDAEAVRYAWFVAEYREKRHSKDEFTRIIEIINNESSETVYKAHQPMCTAAHDPIKSACTR